MIRRKSLFDLASALDGLPVLGCLSGTPAHRAGVRYGDVLLSVNGHRTRSFGDYVEAKALRQDGMTIVLFREGEEAPIELAYDAPREEVDPVDLLTELVSMRVLPSS